MTETTAIARQQPPTLKSLLQDPTWQKRFEEILGKRAAQFVSSVLSVGGTLGTDCEPTSIIASAMTAATLDLPVDKNLGFAWIVPYKKGGNKLAQFQMGYKGYIQLGLRTGQYERMNARVINAEAFQGWDEVGEPIIDWSLIDESKPSVGYVFAFKLVNGFTKIAYWPRERVETHAKRYSQSYKGNYDSPWKSNFDAMALKTVVKNELAKWGILSIEMVTAIKHDQSTKRSLEDEPQYPDGTDINGHSEELKLKTQANADALREKLTKTDEPGAEPETETVDAQIMETDTTNETHEASADAVETEPELSIKDQVSQIVFQLQKEYGVKSKDLDGFLPEGVKKYSDLTEEQAVEILPSVQQLLETKQAG